MEDPFRAMLQERSGEPEKSPIVTPNVCRAVWKTLAPTPPGIVVSGAGRFIGPQGPRRQASPIIRPSIVCFCVIGVSSSTTGQTRCCVIRSGSES